MKGIKIYHKTITQANKFILSVRFPAVVRLAVHLPGEHRVFFRPENARAQADRPAVSTQLAAFDLNSHDDFAKTLLYSEIPAHYTLEKGSKAWKRRKEGTAVDGFPGVKRADIISRVYTVSPRNKELFCLRLLLLNVRGPTGYEDLRTVDGHVFQTFEEACMERGLLESDTHWEDCLEEAILTQMPHAIRFLFTVIVVHCNAGSVRSLWNRFKDGLGEDFRHAELRANPEANNVSDRVETLTLLDLQRRIYDMSGKTMTEVGLPEPPELAPQTRVNREVARETNYNQDELLEFVETPTLTHDQTIILEAILNKLQTGDKVRILNNMFLLLQLLAFFSTHDIVVLLSHS